MGGFRDFLLRGNPVQLAVAVIIGVAFGNVVTAVTKGLITPLLGIFGGVPEFAKLFFEINKSQFLYGLVIDALIALLITALVLYYLVVVPSEWLMDRFKKVEESKSRDCPECTSSISKNAKKCPFCTSEIEPVPIEEKPVGGTGAGDAPAEV